MTSDLIRSLIVVRASGHLADGQRRYPRWELTNAELQRLLEEGVGGVILLGGSATEVRERTAQLRRWAGKPLLLCADVEEGVGQRFEGATWLVPPLALGQLHRRDPGRATALAERYGRCTGRDARALGLNWVLGPVCDVNNNPANPVINVRAWGEGPDAAAELAAGFCRGVQAEGVLACAKHFPGHGDTATDSHLELPLIAHSRDRLEAVELPPFRSAIAAGVAAVMTAHLMLPALDAELPATLSRAVLSGLLRQGLGFDGLIVTDALVMEAIAGRYGVGEAAVLALAAGADLVLMPGDADLAMAAIATALEEGRLDLRSLEASAARRQRALASTEIATSPAGPPNLPPLEPDQALALELVQASLERQGPRWSRPRPGQASVNLIRCDNALSAPFLPLTAPALNLPGAAGMQTCLLDRHSPSPWSGDPQAPLALERLPGVAQPDSPAVLLQLFVRGNPFRGSAGAEEPWAEVVQQLQTRGQLAGLVVYGSPYLWQGLRPLLATQIPAAYSPGQMPLAQAEALASLGVGDTEGQGGFTD
ncbi:glycosyl hydrolase family 3 [Cyanobium sp. HWJ4-Hawea]|uniref:glycoside hydrolase family 3 N-terminal domain-containing protein n=1 Tax=Cyanobium sp. HWJ4-Hawea TaxID=2823713 RepID=UPI0020CEF4C7|nr:glycoside hydrolase family 3 N-terminal domain-containing protein [Cyanobium sp. HWJ4-Hawea]MCP9809926.1 glycosyl hydrolase family 3 [Cyanobium sp. HWJ4-Hawea]